MRRILLDSCVWLWWLDDNPTLGKQAKALINDGRNQLFISAATVWEIAIKRQKGNAQQAATLPPIHQDPFDRMLIAQAQAEGLELMTADIIIPKYSIRVILARV